MPFVRILSFKKASNETIPEAWERLQEYVLACPHHEMNNWLILQSFYNGLNQIACDHVDAAAGGAFFSLTPKRATSLVTSAGHALRQGSWHASCED